MKRAEAIYNANKQAMDKVLKKYGYECTYDGLLEAICERGKPFVNLIFEESFHNWDNADGEKTSWWDKFKNIFHSAAQTADTAASVAGGADRWINPDKQDDKGTATTQTEPAPWKPKLLYWLIGSLILILILVLIFLYSRKK